MPLFTPKVNALILATVLAIVCALFVWADDMHSLCDVRTDTHCVIMPPSSVVVVANTTVEIYAPNHLVGRDANPAGPRVAAPSESAGRVRYLCKGDKAITEWDWLFSNQADTGSRIHASPSNDGRGTAAFTDGNGSNPAPNVLIKTFTKGVDIKFGCS